MVVVYLKLLFKVHTPSECIKIYSKLAMYITFCNTLSNAENLHMIHRASLMYHYLVSCFSSLLRICDMRARSWCHSLIWVDPWYLYIVSQKPNYCRRNSYQWLEFELVWEVEVDDEAHSRAKKSYRIIVNLSVTPSCSETRHTRNSIGLFSVGVNLLSDSEGVL